MTIDDEILHHARTVTERVIASRFADDAAQGAEVLNALWSDAAYIHDMKAMSRVSNEADVTVRLNQMLKDRPELAERTPSVETVAEHLLQKQLAIFGRDKLGERRLSTLREAQRMSAADRRASGAKAEPPAQPVSDKSETKAVPLHARPYDWNGWNSELMTRSAKHPGALLPSERKSLIDAIKQDSLRVATNGQHPADREELARLKARDPKSLSPIERATMARLEA